jgi:hypothetical protein
MVLPRAAFALEDGSGALPSRRSVAAAHSIGMQHLSGAHVYLMPLQALLVLRRGLMWSRTRSSLDHGNAKALIITRLRTYMSLRS